jgi:hypothetical protein
MKTWVLNNKKLIFWVISIGLVIFLIGHYLPKQDCIAKISTYGDNYLYPYDGTSDKRDSAKRFKTRNDALDYCMAQRWISFETPPSSTEEEPLLLNSSLTPEQEELREKRIQELQRENGVSNSAIEY